MREVCLKCDYTANISKISLIAALYAVKHVFCFKDGDFVLWRGLSGGYGVSKQKFYVPRDGKIWENRM